MFPSHDRGAVVEFRPTIKEWLVWAKDNTKPIVYNFIKQNEKFLEYDDKKGAGLEANKVYPSRRSWKRFSDCLPEEWIEEKKSID